VNRLDGTLVRWRYRFVPVYANVSHGRETLMKKLAVALFFCTLPLVACGDDYSCKDYCEAGNSCDGVTQEDCDAMCSNIDKLNDKADCGGEFDDVLSCVKDNEDEICDENSNACDDEMGKWVGCGIGYCMTHSTEEICASAWGEDN